MNVGIICEYNPFHLGHRKQIVRIREDFGADTGVVCAMSGNFVQRGHPAIFDKTRRAEAAVRSGADLVVELPVPVALSSAEGFAAGGVSLLSRLCDGLCFGAETPDSEELLTAAQALLSEDFPPRLREQLATGKSFPAARQGALEAMGLSGSLLESPNNILAVEYCKAILAEHSRYSKRIATVITRTGEDNYWSAVRPFLFYGACQRFGCTFHQVERTDRFVLNGVFIQLMNLSACENLHII